MALTKITSDVIGTGAITSDHLASGAVTHSSLSSITTDNVSEGSSNTYFTNARARGSVSVTGGNLSYDSGTGVIQLTTDQIRTAVSGGTGVSISAGEISIGQDVSTSSTPTFGNITTTGYIAGPATFTIDPAAVGDNTGTLVIAGNLQVDGTTTTINSTTVNIDDLNIQLATGAINAAAANGAGITVDGASATITYDGTNDEWDFNKDINVTGGVTSTALSVKKTGFTRGTFEADGDNQTGIQIKRSNSSNNTDWEIYSPSIDTDLRFYNGGDKLTIDTNGNVGIGTISPSKKLHVYNTASADVALLESTQVFSTLAFKSSTNASTVTVGIDGAGNASFENKLSSGNMRFVTNGTEAMRIDSSGDVLIGQTSQTGYGFAQKLVVGDGDNNDGITIQSGSTHQGNLAFNHSDGTTAHGRISYQHGTNYMQFFTNNTERMRIDSNGLVHLGNNTNTDHKGLHIYKSTNDSYTPSNFNNESLLRLNAPNAEGNYAGITYTHGGGSEFFTGLVRVGATADITDYVLQGYNGNTNAYQEYMRIDSSGNVGIGNSSPSSYYSRSLVVSATAEQGITIAATGTSMSNYLMFADGTTGNEQYRGYIAYSHTNDRMAFAAGGEEKMYINSSGSVGIGTDSPDTNLHVKGSNNSAGDLFTQVGPGNCPSITIQNAGTTDNNNAALYFRDDQDMRGSINMRFTNHSTHASELRFATTLANNTREKFVMTAEGQLGINKMSGFDSGGFGTPMVVIKQKVNSTWGGINVEANGNDSIFSISCPDSGATINTSYRINANHKPLTMMCAGQDGIQIGTSGNVRIGSGNVASNAQSHQLHVDSGNIGYGLKVESQYGYGLQGSNNSAYYHHDTDRGMYYFDTACYANGGFHTYSDSRLKENVTTITGALDKVALMNGVTFTWDNSERVRGPEGKQFGVLAQNMLEVDSALPTLNIDPLEEQDNIDDSEQDTDYYSMDYSRLTPFFIEAIKELKTELDAAKARISELEG